MINKNDLPHSPHNAAHNSANNTDEQRIQDFLKKFVNTQPTVVPKTLYNPFATLDPTQYTTNYYNDINTEEKIEKFKKILQNIENQTLPIPNTNQPLPPTYTIPYAQRLNPSQYTAATTVQGAILVLAGAGTGKTHTVSYRVGFMLESGINPQSILLLTFTRKAATNLILRVNQLLKNRQADLITNGTFHGVANYFLRRYSGMIGLSPNFIVIDSADSQDVIDLVRQEMKFDKRNKAFPRKERIYDIISKARNLNTTPTQIIDTYYKGLTDFANDIETIASAFQKYKKANQLLDYDDLIDTLRNELKNNSLFRKKIQDQYEYIMVDEFQDTNLIQKEIIDLIAQKKQNVMVVGDDAQSIYAFRGANFENILLFPQTYPNCKIIQLQQNYRSNQPILDFTNQIANNALIGYPKSLFSENKNPLKPTALRFSTPEEEATFIVDKILELRENSIPLNEIAVLYRSSFQGNYVQAELLVRNIPYIVVGGIKFTERRHIKDVISYLRLVMNPLDAVSWNRVLKLVQGIGNVTASKIIAEIQQNEGNLTVLLQNKAANKFAQPLTKLQETLVSAANPYITISQKIDIITQYYAPILQLIEDDIEQRLADLEVLQNLAAKYELLEKFLTDFALDPPTNKFQNRSNPLIDETEDKPVTLSTIHSAKGLEWYCVFLPHLLDGVMPSAHALKNFEEMEEERRLFYVACSRAKEYLYLTLPAFASSWDSFFTQPTRFLAEINKTLFNN